MKLNMRSLLLYWIAFKLHLPLHNYLKWWLWSITHSSWNIEVFLGCKDALDDPGGVYRNSDGLRVRVEPRSLTWAELRGVDEAKPSRSRGVQPKSGSEAQLWRVDRLSYDIHHQDHPTRLCIPWKLLCSRNCVLWTKVIISDNCVMASKVWK